MSEYCLQGMHSHIENLIVHKSIILNGTDCHVRITPSCDSTFTEVDELIIRGIYCTATNIFVDKNCIININGTECFIDGECEHRLNVITAGCDNRMNVKIIDSLDTISNKLKKKISNTFKIFIKELSILEQIKMGEENVKIVQDALERLSDKDVNLIDYIAEKNSIKGKQDIIMLNISKAAKLDANDIKQLHSIVSKGLTNKQYNNLMAATYSVMLVTVKKFGI